MHLLGHVQGNNKELQPEGWTPTSVSHRDEALGIVGE